MRTRKSQRGMALITAVTVVMVVTIISVGVIRFATLEVAGSVAAARREAVLACADAGRQILVANARQMGLRSPTLRAVDLPLDSRVGPSRTRVVGGHVFQSVRIAESQMTGIPEASMGPSKAGSDESNRLPGESLGRGQRIIVHCVDGGEAANPASGRQIEVEFLADMGL